MTKKTAFFEGWFWLKFNNLRLALGTNLNFYTSVAKGLKLKVLGANSYVCRSFEGKTGKGPFWPPSSSWIGLRMPVSLNQYRATVEILNNCTFVCISKCENLFSVRHFQDFCLTVCTLHYNGKKPIFLILFLMWLTSKYNACSGAKFFSVLSFITVVMNVWIAIWLYIFSVSLSGDVQLNPGHKDKSSSAFSICHCNWNSITAHSYAKVSLIEAYIKAQ